MLDRRRTRAILRAASVRVIRSLLRRADVQLARQRSPLAEPLEARRLLARASGIDVSSHSGVVDWSQVAAAGYSFGYARSSEGVGFTDAQLSNNLTNGAAAGVLMGVYHHATPTVAAGDAVAEADYFVSVAGDALRPGSLRPALDVSEGGAAMGKPALSAWVNAFLDRVESTSGVEPIVYTNNSYATTYLDASVAANHDLWIARWSTAYGDPNTTGSPPTGAWAGVGETWDVWQYSNAGPVPGVAGAVDRDVFNGDRAALDALVIGEADPSAFGLRLDFGPAGASVPAGYVGVDETLFGTQSGRQMGWLQSGVTTYSRTGGSAPDDRYRTYAMPALGGVSRAFEVEVPNGSYVVRVVCGSPDQTGNNQKITVEGVTAVNKLTTSAAPFVTGTATVNVTDGRLTLAGDYNGWANTRLAFVEILQRPPTTGGLQASFAFGPDGMKAIPGYRTDLGNSFGEHSNGYTFGWTDATTSAAVANSGATFYRGDTSDKRLGSGIGTTGKVWEMQVPNGTYYVKLVAGDGDVTSGTYRYAVENNANFLDGTAGVGNARWIKATGTVNVTDGKLTIADAPGGSNHALAYVEITNSESRSRGSVVAPTDVVATSAGDNVTDVRWTDQSDNEDTFVVERATSLGGPWTVLGTTYANAGMYGDDSGENGATYYYRVSSEKSPAIRSNATVSNVLTTPATNIHGRKVYNPPRTNWTTDAKIEAENYDVSGSGTAYYDTTDGNAGGYYRTGNGDIGYNVTNGRYFVGWERTGEWQEYTVDVPASGTYRLEVAAASEGAGGKLDLSVDGLSKAVGLQVPDTGSFVDYQTVQSDIFTLSAGVGQLVRITAATPNQSGYWVGDLDWVKLVPVTINSAGVTAIAVSPKEIDLDWHSAVPSDFDGSVSIYRRVAGETGWGSAIALVGNDGGFRTYNDAPVNPETTYEYKFQFTGYVNYDEHYTATLFASATTPSPAIPPIIVSVATTRVELWEAGASIDQPAISTLTFTRSPNDAIPLDLSSPVSIDVTFGGTAKEGVDFEFPSVVTIPAGQASVGVSLVLIDDHGVEGDEQLTVIAEEGSSYLVEGPLVSILIHDSDIDVGPEGEPVVTDPGVTLAVTPASSDKLFLKWNDPYVDETGWVVEEWLFDPTLGRYSYSTVTSTPLPADSTSFFVTGLASGSDHSYRVRAIRPADSIRYSNIAGSSTLNANGGYPTLPVLDPTPPPTDYPGSPDVTPGSPGAPAPTPGDPSTNREMPYVVSILKLSTGDAGVENHLVSGKDVVFARTPEEAVKKALSGYVRLNMAAEVYHDRNNPPPPELHLFSGGRFKIGTMKWSSSANAYIGRMDLQSDYDAEEKEGFDDGVWKIVAAPPLADLDVDSNNDGTIDGENGANGTDDSIEDAADQPGVIVKVNDDDDDKDGVVDSQQTTSVPGENDLVPMKITVPSELTSGQVKLSITEGADKVRLWQAADKSGGGPVLGGGLTEKVWEAGSQPSQVFIEAIAAGAFAFTLAVVPTTGSTTGPATDSVSGNGVGTVFVDKDGNEVSKLKVAKWQNAFNADGSVKNDFIDLDPDRFRIRVTDMTKKNAGTITVKVSTDSEGTAYDDDATEVTLTETATPGVFESKTQLLMSDTIDDDYQVDGVADDAKDDRSHIVALGGKVRTEYALASGKVIENSVKVPALKTVKLNVNLFKVNGTAVMTRQQIESDIALANERYAQIGLQIQATIHDAVDAPNNVDLSNGLAGNGKNANLAQPEQQSLLSDATLRTTAENDIEVYYVNFFDTHDRGFAVGDPRYPNSVIMSADERSIFTLPHEIGHILSNDGNHYEGSDKQENLMRGQGTSGKNGVSESKRLTESQQGIFFTSSLTS